MAERIRRSMGLVVLLRGVNVGGHRRFRPSVLAKELSRFDVVNVGAAGTFVVRKRVSRAQLRAEMSRRLPFETDVMICGGRDVLRLTASAPFAGHPSGPKVVRFVSVLARRAKRRLPVPLDLPAEGEWGVRVLAHDGQFVVGIHRREMKAIRHLGLLEKMLGAPVTVRGWNTMLAVARILEDAG